MSNGSLIRLAREFSNLRVRDLAELASLTPAAISAGERGELRLSTKTRWRVMEILLGQLCRVHDIQAPRCTSEASLRRELQTLVARSEVLRAEASLRTADALMASCG